MVTANVTYSRRRVRKRKNEEPWFASLKEKNAFIENLLIAGMALLAVAAAIFMDHLGLPERWHAAILGTLVPFGGVALVFQRKWPFWRFWAALGICLAVHLLATWIVFERVLAPFRTMGILIWVPVGFGEGILLLGFVPMIEKRFPQSRNS